MKENSGGIWRLHLSRMIGSVDVKAGAQLHTGCREVAQHSQRDTARKCSPLCKLQQGYAPPLMTATWDTRRKAGVTHDKQAGNPSLMIASWTHLP